VRSATDKRKETGIIAILSPSRSGSTMFHLMLSKLDGAFGLGEVYAYFRPKRKHHINPPCYCDRPLNHCIWNDLNRSHISNLHKYFLEDKGYNWIIDESKDLSWYIDTVNSALSNNIKVYTILLIKDPINWMNSYYKRNLPLKQSFEKHYVQYYEKFLSLGAEYCSIQLEELITKPREVLTRVCQMLSLSYSDDLFKFWEDGSKCHLFGSKGVRTQLERGVSSLKIETPSDRFYTENDHFIHAVEHDKALTDMLVEILKNDVFKKEHLESQKSIIPTWNKAWYYRSHLVKSIRKYVPAKSKDGHM